MEQTLPTSLPTVSAASEGTDRSALLRYGLGFNAALCSSTGLVALVFASPLSDWMSCPAWVLRLVGVALVAYTPLLLWLKAQPNLRPWHGIAPAVADDAWIAGVLVLAIGGFGLSDGGRWLVALTAIPVLASGLLQLAGALRLRP